MNSVNEGNYPTWVKVAVIALAGRLSSLEKRVSNTDDMGLKLDYIGKMTATAGYMSGLGIAIDTNDKRLLSVLKRRGVREGWTGDSEVFLNYLNEVDDELVTLMKSKKEKLTPAQKLDPDGDGKIDRKVLKKLKQK